MPRAVLEGLKVEKWWEKGANDWSEVFKVSGDYQGWLGREMMVGFVQDTRGKLMRKMQRLGQIREGLWMTCETYEKRDDDGCFIDVLWVEVCCKRTASQNTEIEQEKN